MNGMLSVFTADTVNLAVAVLSFWWLGVVLLTLQIREQADPA